MRSIQIWKWYGFRPLLHNNFSVFIFLSVSSYIKSIPVWLSEFILEISIPTQHKNDYDDHDNGDTHKMLILIIPQSIDVV